MASECDSVSIKYRGDGTTVLYTFPFTYMSYKDVVVFLYDETTEKWVNQFAKFVFANATTVEFLTAPPVPEDPDLSNIWIARKTDLEQMLKEFYPGSAIRAQDLNDDFDQLRLAIQEGRCSLEDALNDIDENTWHTDETYTYDDQVNQRWVEADDTKIATSDAIRARHDAYVQSNKPPTVVYEQTGKTWQNTDDCWSSYWQNSVDQNGNDSKTWVAYVNTGPRGEQGPQGPPGQSIVGPPPGLQEPPTITSNVPNNPDGTPGDATSDVTADTDGKLQFTFGIPQGIKGDKGDQGDKGDKGDKGDPIVTVSDTAPVQPSLGEIWFNGNDADAYFYYQDGVSNQWVSLIKPGPEGPQGPQGPEKNTELSDTAPLNPSNGEAWFNTKVAKLFVYYDDGSSKQWIQV